MKRILWIVFFLINSLGFYYICGGILKKITFEISKEEATISNFHIEDSSSLKFTYFNIFLNDSIEVKETIFWGETEKVSKRDTIRVFYSKNWNTQLYKISFQQISCFTFFSRK